MLFTMYPLRNAFSSCTYAPRASRNHKVVSYTSLRVHLLPQESRRLRLPSLFVALSPIFLFLPLPAFPYFSRYLRSRDTRVRKLMCLWLLERYDRERESLENRIPNATDTVSRVTASIIRGEPRFSRNIGVDEALCPFHDVPRLFFSRQQGCLWVYYTSAAREKAARFHGDDAKVSATSG